MSSSTDSASDQGESTRLLQEPLDPLRWWSLAAVSLATFMTYLDLNVTNVAIPTIQRNLHLSVAGLEWVISSYLLTLAGLLLAGGRLADAYGRRRLFMAGLAIFTLASLAAGLAGNSDVLIISRAIQGVGAALLTPATLAIITAAFADLKERTTAIGLWTVSGALGLAIGPIAGGLISQNLRWGWIFLINVPIGVITFAVAIRTVRESRAATARRSLDLPGLLASAVALVALTYALIEGNSVGWSSAQIIASFVVAATAAAVFFAIEARTAEPMVDLGMFRSAPFSGGITVQMVWAFGSLSVYFFTAVYLQDILGFSPSKAGLLFVPMAFALAAFAGLSSVLEARIGQNRTVAFGLTLMAAGLLLFLFMTHSQHTSFASLLPSVIVLGAGMGMTNVPLTNAVMGNVTEARAGVASALLNDSRELAGLLGITIIGVVLRSDQSAALRAGSSPANAFTDGYHRGLWVAIALLAVGVAVSWGTLRPSRNPVTVPRPLDPARVPAADCANSSWRIAHVDVFLAQRPAL